MRTAPSLRYWEIDLTRGIAVVMMVIFHTVFDLGYFSILALDVYTGFWRQFALATAFLFVFLVGISLSISGARRKGAGGREYRHYLWRGSGIFALGLLITVVTFVLIGEGFIQFGILHLIGLSIMLSPLFLNRPREALLGGIGFVILGGLVGSISGPVYLLWLGIHPVPFYTLDYFPLFPWFGIVLLGYASGWYLYPGGRRTLSLPESPSAASPLCWMGRHSLGLYLIHQPILLAILFVLVPGAIHFPGLL